MAHRKILTSRQRNLLLTIPENESAMLNHYVLSTTDLTYIQRKQDTHNRLGFAIQLCALRYPGRYLSSDDTLPHEFLSFVGAQIGLTE